MFGSLLGGLSSLRRGSRPATESTETTAAAAAADAEGSSTGASGPFAAALRLRGERVLLRPLMAEDAEAMFAYASDPEVTRFLPWEPAASVENVRPFLEEQAERRRRRDSLGFAVVLTETGEMIGSTDLMDLNRGQAELGYLLARPYWGRGLMTEAAGLTLAHGFGPLRLSRVIAFADVENTGSRRVLEKLGMHVWGSEMRRVRSEDRLYIRYEIKRADWSAQQK